MSFSHKIHRKKRIVACTRRAKINLTQWSVYNQIQWIVNSPLLTKFDSFSNFAFCLFKQRCCFSLLKHIRRTKYVKTIFTYKNHRNSSRNPVNGVSISLQFIDFRRCSVIMTFPGWRTVCLLTLPSVWWSTIMKVGNPTKAGLDGLDHLDVPVFIISSKTRVSHHPLPWTEVARRHGATATDYATMMMMIIDVHYHVL